MRPAVAFRPRDLRWMVEESMTLSERLGGSVVPGGSGRHAGAAGTRLHKWRRRVANGDTRRFEKRLRWDGLDVESALRLLGPVRLKRSVRLPAWIGLVEASTAATRRDTPFERAITGREVFDPRNPQPFEELLWQLVPEAGRRLLANLGACRERLSSGALVDLARGLLGRLCRTAERTLRVEFDVFRSRHPGHPLLHAPTPWKPSRGIYRDFVRDMGGEGLVGWLLRYPMLARLLATCCGQWIAATVDLVRRLDRDEDLLRATFEIQDRRLEIAGVAPDLSDPHREGRTVCAIRFRSGARLVYKPRRLALDRHLSNLLAEIEGLHEDLASKRLRVIDRGEYGWVEWIGSAPCADAAAVERFYRRSGSLTCLAYVLGGSDLHAGNLIACGDQPVPIDIECMTGAPLASPHRDAADSAPCMSPPGSVLRTGLPPVARSGDGNVFRIAGGLADPDSRQAPEHSVAHVNTDRMAWRGHTIRRGSEPNAPVLDGRRQSASAYLEPLIDGFRQMYRTLSHNRERLRATEGIRQLEREEFRVLIRDTRSYARLLEDALGPQNVTSGPDWSIALDVLAAPALTAHERPRCWATRAAERIELERLDVPLFTGSMAGPSLRSALGIRLEEQLDRTGYAISTRLARLNPDDLEQQLRILRMSFAIAGVKRSYRERRVRAGGPRNRKRPHGRSLAEVHSLVALLKRLALDEETRVTWYGPGGPPAGTARLDPVGIDLFGGTSGIALFLAAAAAVTGRRDARALAARVFDPLCERLEGSRTSPLDLAAEIGIGGATGLGGLIYALVHAGRFLGRPDYLASASTAARGIDPGAIRADATLDVLSGAAGAVLGLLSLHRATGYGPALQTAIRCGEHILDSRRAAPGSGLRTWRTPHGPIAPGFAHGPSGIGYALRRLGDGAGMHVFRVAAAESWAAEDWAAERQRPAPDRVSRSERPPATHDSSAARSRSWCQGTAGMGLARLAALEDRDARSAIESAIEAAPNTGAPEADGLCCGRLGQAEFLFSAGRRLGRGDLCEAAHAICRATVAGALAAGRYATGADEGFRPGLFQGASGIGYQLLRMHAPDAVQSVLLWE
ncbi:MAG: type 2 lantipeptide synthetase LanM [Acidobacteria bacterium]|nr:type 2 lantipeptide synthetase LanM [Acidobacteriota bacterium]